MMTQALMITLLGMGGVFFFLILLVCAVQILRILMDQKNTSDLSKIAVAIAVAENQK